jgi:N utilization substance protein A
LVEIKSIAREAGQRSKVAVSANQDGIDPVGACVGQRGVRIQAIVNELSGEKIDIVEWSPNPAAFIANALSPAKVLNVKLSEDTNGDKVASVVVQDKQLSLAIGKEGQNARLAAKLTGWRIDIKSESQSAEEAAKREAAEAALRAELTEPEPGTAVEAPAELQAEMMEAAPERIEEAVAAEAEAAMVPSPPTQVTEPTAAATAAETAEPVTEAAPAIEPEVEKSFEEALAEFEAVEDGETLDERERKRKEDRAKRRTLVFDEKLGKVVAKHKSKRAQDWFEEDEAEAVE